MQALDVSTPKPRSNHSTSHVAVLQPGHAHIKSSQVETISASGHYNSNDTKLNKIKSLIFVHIT